MADFGHWIETARRVMRRLLHRQPAVKLGPSLTVDWRENVKRFLEGNPNEETYPDVDTVINEIVNRRGWMPGEAPLFFNVADNPWQGIVTDVAVTDAMIEIASKAGPAACPFYIEERKEGYMVMIKEAPRYSMIVFDGLKEETAIELRDRLNKAVAIAEPERGQQALDLLREMLAGLPDPWIENDYAGVFCFFCGASKERLHEPNCTYLKALELLKGE